MLIEQKTINGVVLRCIIMDPAIDDIHAVFKLGASVKEMAEGAGADIAINFNYADTDHGIPIGRLVVDGKVVNPDIPKTVARDELYMLPDRSIHIGKAPANAMWAVQGSPPLLRGGAAVQDGINRDQLSKDIWSRAAFRTAAGVTASGELVLVRTYTAVFLPQLTSVMLELGCVDALNGDGGGSSYLWPAENGWGRKLGSAIVAKRRKADVRTFKRYTLQEYIDKVVKPVVGNVQFSGIHVHGTWKPTIADFHRDGGLKLVQSMWRFHTMTRGWSDIAQHATIDPDGYIWDGRPLTSQPASAAGYNGSSSVYPFMFEMIGNFDIGAEKLEGQQLATAAGLCKAVMDLWHRGPDMVHLHREYTDQKTCPGSGIEKPWFMAQVAKAGAPPSPPIPTPPPGPVTPEPVRVIVNGADVTWGCLIENHAWVPARPVGHVLDTAIDFKNNAVYANGKVLTTRLIGGRGYVLVRELAAAVGATVDWDQDKKIAKLIK